MARREPSAICSTSSASDDELHERRTFNRTVNRPTAMVAAARAFVNSQKTGDRDERTSALDADGRGAFLQLLYDAAGTGHDLLFVSHTGLAGCFDRSLSFDLMRARLTDGFPGRISFKLALWLLAPAASTPPC